MSGRPGRWLGRRTIKSRWRSLGCTSSTSTSASSAAWMSKNSPCRSWPMSMTRGFAVNRRNWPILALAPSFSNLVLSGWYPCPRGHGNPSATEPVHLYQIWLLPNEKGLAPSYEQKAFAEDERQGRLRLVASPDAGTDRC
jgi:hypothetical protein